MNATTSVQGSFIYRVISHGMASDNSMKNYSGSFTAMVATGILLAIAAILLAVWAASIVLG